MRASLGEEHWSEFVQHASRYKRAFVGAFDPPDALLSCVGQYGGGPCPRAFAFAAFSRQSLASWGAGRMAGRMAGRAR